MGVKMISAESHGSFKNTEAFLAAMQKLDIKKILDSCGREGVLALSQATPQDTGIAARSWGYEVEGGRHFARIWWTNTDVENGFPVVIMLQYGYGTGTGGYVEGRDFINPAIQPVMDKIADKVWKAVTSA